MSGRGRVRDVVARRVDDLSKRRDALDAEHAERRAREDTALELWAGLTVRRDEIETAREGELHRLETERIRVRDEAMQRVARVEADQAAVLLELNRDGRTVAQLSALFGLPLKQVRTMLRAARSTASDTARDSTQAPGEVARQTTATGAGSIPAAAPDADTAPDRGTDRPAGAGPRVVERTVGEPPGTEQPDGDADLQPTRETTVRATTPAVVGSG